LSHPQGPAGAPARPAEPAVIRLTQPIYTFDIDFAGVVSNINYLKWSEIWRTEFARQLGLTIEAMLAAGLLPLMVRQELNFRRPMRLGQQVSLEGWVERIGTSSITLWLEMRDAAGGTLCCDNRQVMVMTDPRTGASVPIPPEFRARLQEHT
jgi:acyl-CoA thioester hydrolase